MKKYVMQINGQSYESLIVEYSAHKAKLIVNGIDFVVEFGEDDEVVQPHMYQPNSLNQIIESKLNDSSSIVSPSNPPTQELNNTSANGQNKVIKSPLPGTIADVKVEVGQQIKINQVVIILEAMKMESEIYSEFSGTVKKILVAKGQSVVDGQVLVEL